jgi:hypothetical protein
MVDIRKLNKNWEILKKAESKLEKKLDKLVNEREDNYNDYEEIREVFWNLQEKINEVEKLGLLNEKNDTKKE